MPATFTNGSVTIPIYVRDFSTTLGLSTTKSLMRRNSTTHAIAPRQSEFRMTLECPSEAYRERLEKFIRAAQQSAIAIASSKNEVTFFWPEYDMYYRGHILETTRGSSKWEWASEMSVSMELTHDRFYQGRANFSSKNFKEDWKFDGENPDVLNMVTPYDGLYEGASGLIGSTSIFGSLMRRN